MQISKPVYYDTFRCLAENCPDSCCKEWDVQIDPESAAKYRALPGDLGNRLRQVMTEEDGETVMILEEGRCPMWRRDGLCRIQAELGEGGLCKTCQEFPRLRHDYGDFVELGLELSCPEAARLIFGAPIMTRITTQILGGEVPEYDQEAMAVLCQTREEALRLLQDESRSVPETLAVFLMYGCYAQTLLDCGEAGKFDASVALEEAREFAAPADSSLLLEFYLQLEILTDCWRERLCDPWHGEWTEQLCTFAVYSVERYWLQAVSDYDLISRIKMIIAACLLIQLLGGDVIATAQLYSKEIENSADNVDAILNAAYTHTAFTDDKLLGWLLISGN